MDCKKILIIDDSPVVLKVLAMTLSAYGYDALTASNGQEGLMAVRQARPDLILLDINFRDPGAQGQTGTVTWDGFTILDWLSQMEEARAIPVVIITGGDPKEYEKRCFGPGVVGLLPKPIEPDSLLTTVRQILGGALTEA